MDYFSIKQAANDWGVSVRVVQQYCCDGRIPGAKKYERSWMIPMGSIKPLDPRKVGKQPINAGRSAFLLTTAALAKNKPNTALADIPERFREIVAADIAYRRGDPEPAKEYWRQTGCEDEVKLSAASLATAAAISSGDYALYYEIQSFLKRSRQAAATEKERELLSLPDVVASVSMAAPNMVPGWLKKCDFSMFSSELSPFLMYLYAMHLRNIGDRPGLLYTVRAATALTRQEDTFTWLDVYFLVLGAIACYGMGDEKQAEGLLSDALELAMPWGFIMPFSDCLGSFGGLLEKLMLTAYPQQLDAVTALWQNSFKNWVNFHNVFTKENITTILTAREYQTAHMIANGATYAQAAKSMSLSVGRIKNILLEVYSKLYIKNRHQLRSYIL